MIQLFLIVCFGLLALTPIVLVVSLVRFLLYRTDLRRLVLAASFLVGTLVTAWVIWWAAIPEDWMLPFGTTLQASIDSDTYGHPIEHAAEVLASKTIILGVCGGLLTAGLVWAAPRIGKSKILLGLTRSR